MILGKEGSFHSFDFFPKNLIVFVKNATMEEPKVQHSQGIGNG